MNLFSIDTETCNQDGICAAVCPAQVIDFKKGRFPAATGEAEEMCIRCGHCVAVCPTASLSHQSIPVEACPPIETARGISTEQCEQFLRARRSIRKWKQKAVPREAVERLIELARYAPTGHNTQSVQWLALGRPEELAALTGLTVDWMRWMLENMREQALSLHMDQTIESCEAGNDEILRKAPVVLIAHAHKADMMAPTSSTIALSYLELAATSMGLGTCWAGYLLMAAMTFPPMKKILALPEGHQCLGAMMVGYPKYRYHRLPTRKTPNIVWRW